MKQTINALVVLVIITVQSANAFKVDTHALIAQDVTDDLMVSDGAVTFWVGRRPITIPAAPGVYDAVKNFGGSFLLGSIGPDAFPGIFEGQMAIHPGSSKGWGSSDYLNHLMQHTKTLEELAFSYGVATHLAADVFAHTYVNAYAGNCWELGDEDDTVVEQRHFALEGFIAKYNPPRLDHHGNPGTSLARLLNSPPERTKQFVLRTLLMNETIAKKYSDHFPHVAGILKLQNELRELTDDDGPLRKLQLLIEHAVWEYYVGTPITDEQLIELRKLGQRVKNLENKSIEATHKTVDDVLLAIRGINTSASDQRAHLFKALEGVAGKADALLDQLEPIRNRISILQTEHDQLHDQVWAEIIRTIPIPPNPHPRYLDPPINSLRNPAWREHERIRNAARGARTNALNAHEGLTSLKERLRARQNELLQTEELLKGQAKDLRIAFENLDKMFAAGIQAARDANAVSKDGVLRVNADTFPLISLLNAWAADIDSAMSNYVVVNARVICGTIEANPNGSNAWALVQDWLDCELPKIAGIGTAATAKCRVEAHRDKMMKLFDELTLALKKMSLPGLPVEKLEKLKEQLKLEACEEIREYFIKTFAPKLKPFIKLLEQPPTDKILQQTFTRTAGNIALLPISDIADRVRADMGVVIGRNSKVFSRKDFAAYRNALILAKLAMLDGNGLNQLAKELGVSAPTDFADGKPLYPSTSYVATKGQIPNSSTPRALVLYQTLLSIDANHQWHKNPPPYVRESGDHLPAKFAGKKGFRIWDDPQAKEKIFRKLFSGPIAPGLDSPDELPTPMLRILPESYDFRTCKAHPFPDSYENCGCDN